MDKIPVIPGPAGEQQSNESHYEKKMFTRLGVNRSNAHFSHQTLCDANRTGLVCDVPVEVLKVTPGVSGELCLLLKDEVGLLHACMTKNATLKYGRPKPGDALTIAKAYVITSKDYIPMRFICLDQGSMSRDTQLFGNSIESNTKITSISRHVQYQGRKEPESEAEDDLYLFSESGEDQELPQFEKDVICDTNIHTLGDTDDLLDGLDDPF